MTVRHPGSHCGSYCTQAWLMDGAEERPWDKKVERDNRVTPYPAACSGTREHWAPQTQRGRRQEDPLMVQVVIQVTWLHIPLWSHCPLWPPLTSAA